MTNISGTPGKVALRRRLRTLGEEALRLEGWTVEAAGLGKSSMRRITKDGKSKLATIRTSQDTWVAFPRNDADTGWSTLEDADVVVLASVNNAESASKLKAHVIAADTVRAHFDRAYAARVAALHQIQKGRGVWIALYEPEAESPTNLVGAGLGLKFPAVVEEAVETGGVAESVPMSDVAEPISVGSTKPLSISRAKALLAESLGVNESAIRITIDV
jgi:hypothetical protein